MKSNTAVSSLIQTASAVKALPKVVADWNFNSYISVTADNTPSDQTDGYDIEIFPIESIVLPRRPSKGSNKARTGSGTISDNSSVNAGVESNGRYYIADKDDQYQYWTSPYLSSGTGVLASCKPQIVYGETVKPNKIVIKTENSWASAQTFSIQKTTVANPTDSDWTEIANQTTVGNGWKPSGQIVLYWNGTNWTGTGPSYDAAGMPLTTTLTGIRIVVTQLEGGYKTTPDGSAVHSTYSQHTGGSYVTSNTTGFNSRFDLIEISARLESDLTQFLMNSDDTFEISDSSNLYPLGQVTSNQGTLTFSNLYQNTSGAWVPGLFSADNTDTVWYKYIDENAKLTLSYVYYDSNNNVVGTIPQFVGYADSWSGQEQESVEVQMTDYSKFFNDIVVRAALWENLTVPQIIARLMDSIGFTNYSIDQDDNRVTEHQIPVYYTTGDKNMLEVLDDLAQGTQTAIYFDCNNTLRVKTRDFAFSSSATASWNFKAYDDGTKKADIISLTKNTQFEPNYYKVFYSTTNWSAYNNGLPTMQQVWTPEGDTVLRGNPLVRTLDTADTKFYLDSSVVKYWPYSGIVNVEGELVRYEGKEYVYFTGSNGTTRNVTWIKSTDEYNSRNSKTPVLYQYKNYFTGAMNITERGVWNSEPGRHPVDIEGYSARHIVNGTRRVGVAGFSQLKQTSKARINTPKSFTGWQDLLIVTRGSEVDSPYYHYGMKFRFASGASRTTQVAGMVLNNNGTNEDGYYINFTPSRRLGAKERKNRNEMIVYSRVNGINHRLNGTGTALAIGENIDYEVDVSLQTVGSNHVMTVWVNGKNVANITISSFKNASNGKWGMFALGKTDVRYEYIYAVARTDPPLSDDFSFLDRVERGYTGNYWEREWVYSWATKTRWVKKKTQNVKYRRNQMYFDDFGPYVHEVREFDVTFDPSPVLHSRLYSTNDWAATVLDYKATPFGAHFTIANTARYNAVVNGDDTISFAGTGSSVNQVLTVFGRTLVVADALSVVAKNDNQIRRRGQQEAELSSTWIQSKAAAQEIADWMNNHFSYGNDEIELEVFGNPLIEVADVVHVDYPAKHVNADFFVTSVNTTFDSGLSTKLSLRKRV